MKKQITLFRLSSVSILAWGIILLSSTYLFTQNPKWKVFNNANSGLPYTNVSSVTIDSHGNKWIGSDLGGGLCKFDGTNWSVYNKLNSGLPDEVISAITIDSKGNKWIGTQNGLVKFDGTVWTVYNKSNSGLPDNEVLAIAIDSQDNEWIGTRGGGLCMFDGVKWTVYNRRNSGLIENAINAITIDSEGNKWIGAEGENGGGVYKFNGTKFIPYPILSYNNGRALAIDTQGIKWIGTHTGLFKYDGTKWVVYKKKNSGLPKNWINSIDVDSQGNEWIGTRKGGLCKFDGTKWTKYNKSNSGLPENCVRSITIDSQGNKWIGTNTEGLAVFNEDGIKGLNNPKRQIKTGRTNEISTQKNKTSVLKIDSNKMMQILSSNLSSQKTSFPKGGYKTFEEFQKKQPSINYDFQIIRRTKSDIMMNGGVDYKVKSKSFKKSVIKRHIYAISTGDTLYINCLLHKVQFWYAMVLTEGKYIAFEGGFTRDKSIGYETLGIGEAGVALGGAVGGAFAGAHEAMLRYLYVMQTNVGKIHLLDSKYLMELLEPFPDIKRQYINEKNKGNKETLLKYLQLINMS